MCIVWLTNFLRLWIKIEKLNLFLYPNKKIFYVERQNKIEIGVS